MDVKLFIKKVFDAFVGDAEWPIDFTLPHFRFGPGVNECELECGTDPDTFYALDTFSQCPRAYMIKYLAKKPLAIPFYAEVREAVRETAAEFARCRIRREDVLDDFTNRYDELVVGPFPIHQKGKDWAADWRTAISSRIVDSVSAWGKDGWRAVDSYIPVSADIRGCQIKGVVDLLLKNDLDRYAIVVHDDLSGVICDKNGIIPDYDTEGREYMKRLLRKAYLYASALCSENKNCDGRISHLILSLYKPKAKDLLFLPIDWDEREAENVTAWVQQTMCMIDRAKVTRNWPCLVPCRADKKGTITADEHFCHERCTHCINCRWAGMHPHDVAEFADVEKVDRIPKKYLGVEIKLRGDLDPNMNVYKYKGTATLGSKVVRVTTANKVLENLGVNVIGDLAGKSVDDLFNTQRCGVNTLDVLVALFYEKVETGR